MKLRCYRLKQCKRVITLQRSLQRQGVESWLQPLQPFVQLLHKLMLVPERVTVAEAMAAGGVEEEGDRPVVPCHCLGVTQSVGRRHHLVVRGEDDECQWCVVLHPQLVREAVGHLLRRVHPQQVVARSGMSE